MAQLHLLPWLEYSYKWETINSWLFDKNFGWLEYCVYPKVEYDRD